MCELDVVKVAGGIAQVAHLGQFDKAGKAYIEHPQRVSNSFPSNDTMARATALLHDVIEDTEWTADDLRHRGLPEMVVNAVETLTRREGEPPELYYQRVATNELAYRVKLADINDNTSPGRLDHLDEATQKRLMRKYIKALMCLSVFRLSSYQGDNFRLLEAS